MSYCCSASYPEFSMKEISLVRIAEQFSLELIGENKVIKQMGAVTSPSMYQENKITYVTGQAYLRDFLANHIAACIIPEGLKNIVPEKSSVLITQRDPMDVFYEIYNTFVAENRWTKLSTEMGERNLIATTAIIHNNVHVGNDCTIMDNVVILPNTRIGDRVIIKPNTVVGGDGFQVRFINGTKKIVNHVGGVWICDDVEIGSNVCIDRGLFGDFTYIGEQTKVDNLVQIAHSVKIGKECTIAACATICGNICIGDKVWIGANSTINNRLGIGSNCYIGSHSVIRRSLDDNVKAYNPYVLEKIYICDCGETLDFYEKRASCPKCGITYCIRNKRIQKA
jgi:UDP-3-O-[3-hydroxymyristoyl] glucosamine N-acyltransferase